MPLLLLLFTGVGAAAGAGTVWAVNDTSKKLVTAGVVLGLGYVAWVNRASLASLVKV